jgi:prepilin-type N-terminal cleavage/methylation domain-containing protein
MRITNSMPDRTLRPKAFPGFSLLELLVAVSVFLLVSAASFTLFSRHQALLSKEQGLAGLSLMTRNTLTQIELDAINAGAGMVTGVNVPNSPVGVTVINTASASSCYNSTTKTYTSNCFDTLNIIAIDPNTPPMSVHTSSGGCVTTSAAAAYYVTVPSGYTGSALAANFQSGDEVLLVSSTGATYSAAILTSAGSYSSSTGYISLAHNATASNGTYTSDPLGIISHLNSKIGTSFCSTDWLMRLRPIIYTVDTTTNSSDPTLTRQIYTSGTPATVMDQVLSFRCGEQLWNSATTGDRTSYFYDPSVFPSPSGSGTDPYDFTIVRSLRVSLIARTKPSTDPNYSFVNAFDGGAYQVFGSSITVNPRNMSLNDN